MLKKLKNIKPGMLILHVIITLAYPAVKAFRAEGNRLLAFTDALTIIALVLLIGGVIYSLALHGFFDISTYYLQRGFRTFKFFNPRRGEDTDINQSIDEFLIEAREKRKNAFNYPLLLGIVYLLVSVLLAYGPLS